MAKDTTAALLTVLHSHVSVIDSPKKFMVKGAVPLIPSGMAELFYGRRTLKFYRNILPKDGLLAAVRIKRAPDAREPDEKPRRGDRLLFR